MGLKADFNGFETGFATKASLNLWLSEQNGFRRVLPHFCRVKTTFERR
jgi:hypothetical protein